MPSPYPSLYQINTRVWLTELSRELSKRATLDERFPLNAAAIANFFDSRHGNNIMKLPTVNNTTTQKLPYAVDNRRELSLPRSVVVGSDEHKELFCRFFIDTHITFDPAAIEWPELDEASLKLLQSLPVWAEAVEIEHVGTCIATGWAALESDPLIRRAIILQGREEARHAAVIGGLTTRYGIALPTLPPPTPADAEWEYLRFGYSECFDAFFTFAIFAIARDSGLISRALVETFEPILQEEARHILFFVNWEAYCQARSPFWQRPGRFGRGARERVFQAYKRLKITLGARTDNNFALKTHQTITSEITARRFLEICLAENARRLDRYDARLLRPRLVPTIAKALCRVLP